MLRKLARRPSHGTIVAYVALFVALGGTAYAVNTIGSSDVINESLLSEDIKNLEVKTSDIGVGAVFGSRIRDNGILESHFVDDSLSGEKFKGDTQLSYGPDALRPNSEEAVIFEPTSSPNQVHVQTNGDASGSEPVSLELPRPLSQYARGLVIKRVRVCAGPNSPISKLDAVSVLAVSEDGSTGPVITEDPTDRTTYGCFNIEVPATPSENVPRLKILYTFDLTSFTTVGQVGGVKLTLSNAP